MELIKETTHGLVKGSVSEKTNTVRWLGIPYARPPLKELRWHAPMEMESWAGPREAEHIASPSLQKGENGTLGSEDCLYLNIYRPAEEMEKLPILFFIHGGNNQTASGDMMDGDVMAQGLQAVVVTVNFRLNILGWVSLPALKTGDPLEDSGNFGLLDILAALNWTRKNAANFGGEKKNITVCGYSSGARDLLCMMISPLFRGKFSRAITFSGGFTTAEPESAMKTAARAIAPLAVEDQMAENPDRAYEWLLTTGKDVRDWLYSVDAERFAPLMAGAAIRMAVFPHLFADGVVIPQNGFGVLKDGSCMNVPMMCFSGGHEFDFPANNDPLFKNADFSDEEIEKEYRFATKYGGALFGWFNGEQNGNSFSAVDGHEPVYLGRCMWGMDPAVTDPYAAMRVGGTHGLDIYLIMGNERKDYAWTENVWSDKNKAGREALQKIYMGYIRNFLRNGDPNGAGLPTWNPWNCQEKKLMVFDADRSEARVAMTDRIWEEADILKELTEDHSLDEERKKYLLKYVLNGRFFSTQLDLLAKGL